MNVRELGMQVARDQVTAACDAHGYTLPQFVHDELTGRFYAFICKVKALEFSAEYYKALLVQVDQVLGGDQEANFANVPGKVMEMAARCADLEAKMKELDAAWASRMRQIVQDQAGIDHRSPTE